MEMMPFAAFFMDEKCLSRSVRMMNIPSLGKRKGGYYFSRIIDWIHFSPEFLLLFLPLPCHHLPRSWSPHDRRRRRQEQTPPRQSCALRIIVVYVVAVDNGDHIYIFRLENCANTTNRHRLCHSWNSRLSKSCSTVEVPPYHFPRA